MTIIGTWRMISWTRTVVATGATTDAMGADPNGYIAYHDDGRMLALVVDRQKHKLDPHERRRREVSDVRITVYRHQNIRLGEQAAQHMRDPVGTVEREPVCVRAPDPDHRRAERERLDDV